ncbi:hypothetical protein BXZ70DRAFT_187188 [Cristinia sonorae]|uniref:Uncharacterized protein n=1 Tax=Cristinia sonorae TaxID=1940300 RepID=A0A8K0UP55_9AGAR|nr:hypothetical protein BXZ70DRAFT_187188 [Cristinia sonorae]
MERTDIQRLLSSILNSQDVDLEDPDEFDAFLDRLRFFFSENILLAALDLVDRDNVVKVSTPWGYSHFNVFGSTATYTVFPGIVSSTQTTPPFCTCPAYAYSVLLSSSELMDIKVYEPNGWER